MRRVFAVCLALFLFSSFAVRGEEGELPSLSGGEREEEGTSAEETASSLLSDFWSTLPDAARDLLPSDSDDTEALGEAVGFKHLFSIFASGVENAFAKEKSTLAQMLGIALLFTVVCLISGFFGKSPFGKILFDAAASLFLYRLLFPSVTRVFSAIAELGSFALAASPVYVALFSSGGAVTGAAVAGGGFTVFVGVLEVLVSGVLLPLIKVLFALSLLSSFAAGGAVGEIGKRLSAVYIWMLSLASVLLTASLAFQTGLASSADSVAARTVKFAVGNAIPVVGGTVSSALGALEASLSLVKSAFGASAVVALLALLLPVLLEMLLLRFGLSVCSFAADSLGAPSVGAVFSRFRGIYDLMLAALAIVMVLFLLLVALLSRGLAFS